MTLSGRVRRHLQGNVVGYVAVFIALSGTAIALPGHRSVRADDLARGAVKTKAIADRAIERRKLKAQAVTSSKLADGAVSSAKIEDGTLLASDFAPGQLSDAFVFEASGQTLHLPRAGRVYVIATILTGCAAPPCHYGVMIDQRPVEHAAVTLTQPVTEEQITLIGLSGRLEAGNYLIYLVNDGNPTISTVRLSGVLVQ